MRIIDTFLGELEQESKTTRKFLEALPADQMSYKPHEKSQSTGELAMHIATIPGMMSEWGLLDVFEMTPHEKEQKEITKDAVLAAFDKSLADARERLATVDDAKAMATWTFKMGGKTLMQMPRVAFFRGFMFNHLYHHRGQLGVYLRLMGAKVPSSYGPSADDNPMAEMMAAAAKA